MSSNSKKDTSRKKTEMEFTGERFIPNIPALTFLYQEHIVRYVFASQFVNSKIVLDAACGTGYGSSLLLEKGAKKVIGVDISKETIDYCNQNYKKENLQFKIDDCKKLNLGNSYFDTVVSFETLEHLSEPESFLSEVKRVLKKNGLFIVSTPNKHTYQGSNPFHTIEYTEEEFRSILQKYFSNIEIFYQSYPSVLAISKPRQNKKLEEINIPDLGTKSVGDTAMYFIAVCSDKNIKNYNNKLYIFDNKTILQQEYSTLKKLVGTLERKLDEKNLKLSTMLSERISNNLNSQNASIEDEHKKEIIKLQQLVNDANKRLDNQYSSFTKNILRTRAEETLDRLYREILARAPDKLAIMHYLPRLLNEISEQQLREILLQSDEFKSMGEESPHI